MLFIGLGRAYTLGGDFEVTILVGGGGMGGASQKVMGPFLWGKLTPQDPM